MEGGDVTSGGTHDDNIRHAITKLAHLHFPTNNISYKRLLLLGEEKWRVKMYGFTGLDLIKKKDFSKEAEIVKKYKLHKKQPILICTFHPLSSNITETKKETECSFRALKKILKEHDLKCIITYPNNDAGSNFILEKIKKFESIFNNVKLFKSLGRKDYWGLLNLNKSKYRIICIGNSSSGIKESSAFNCPTVNIGVRQEGRIAGKNVIQAKADENDIYTSIMKCLTDQSFLKEIKSSSNPYGIGNAGSRIAKTLEKFELNDKVLIKKLLYRSKMQENILIIILARYGSRRIKNKNMRLFNNKPLVSWSIEQALRISNKNTKVILSTDSLEILDYAEKYANLEKIKRPKSLATSKASSFKAIRHVIKKIKYEGNVNSITTYVTIAK